MQLYCGIRRRLNIVDNGDSLMAVGEAHTLSRSAVGPMTPRISEKVQQSTCGGFTDHLNMVCIDRKALFGKPPTGWAACY